MIKTSGYYEFSFHKLHKSWRRGESPPSLKSYAFPSDKALCLIAALDCYIERRSREKMVERASGEKKNPTSQLLVSFIKPHNAVLNPQLQVG